MRSSPAVRSSSSNARSVTFSRAARCSMSASEKPESGVPWAAAAASWTRVVAAARLAGVPTMRISPAADGNVIGAPGSARMSATRTNVVYVPWRCRRASSASIPVEIMSWLAARVDSSASETDISDGDHIKGCWRRFQISTERRAATSVVLIRAGQERE